MSLYQRLRARGFTIVELLVAIAMIAVLAVIGLVTYTGIQRRSAQSVVQTSIGDAQKVLQAYYVFNRYYPSNIANTDYTAPLTVPLAFYTDSPQTPLYQNLSADQNAQLFLNSCNGFMPVVSGGTTYNTSCVYSGNNMHIKGTVSSNVILNGPTINEASFGLTCGSACETAQAGILSSFLAQGGTFPITVPKKGAALPAPTMQTTGNATRYCLEGRSSGYSDVIYHVAPNSASIMDGPCPADPGLHYP